jgi:hypothetical protein
MFSRRQMMTGIAALAAARPVEGFAAFRCADSAEWGIRTCEAGLEIGSIETVRQRCDYWCWAACIQAVFALNGRKVQQERAVQRLFGNLDCKPARDFEIIQTINGEWIEDDGTRFRAAARQLPLAALAVRISAETGGNRPPGYIEQAWATSKDARALVSELQRGRPLIVGAVGHATVLTAVTYQRNELFNDQHIALTRIVVRDPSGHNPNRRELTAREVTDAFFVAKVEIV